MVLRQLNGYEEYTLTLEGKNDRMISGTNKTRRKYFYFHSIVKNVLIFSLYNLIPRKMLVSMGKNMILFTYDIIPFASTVGYRYYLQAKFVIFYQLLA